MKTDLKKQVGVAGRSLEGRVLKQDGPTPDPVCRRKQSFKKHEEKPGSVGEVGARVEVGGPVGLVGQHGSVTAQTSGRRDESGRRSVTFLLS